MSQKELLKQIAICLVEPEGAGNIGSVARAMKNMGLSRLILVGGVDPDCEETRQMASGHYDIIENALHFDSLKEAVRPFNIVTGTSRRIGKSRRPTHYAKEFPEYLFPLLSAGNETAILFGRERSGLTTEELDLCQNRVLIPTVEDFGSMNISQAVLLIAYELWIAAAGPMPRPERSLATSQDLEGMYEHIEQLLTEVGFIGDANPAWMMRAFRHIFGRASLNRREVRIIRGAFSDIEWYIDHCIETGNRDGKKDES